MGAPHQKNHLEGGIQRSQRIKGIPPNRVDFSLISRPPLSSTVLGLIAVLIAGGLALKQAQPDKLVQVGQCSPLHMKRNQKKAPPNNSRGHSEILGFPVFKHQVPISLEPLDVCAGLTMRSPLVAVHLFHASGVSARGICTAPRSPGARSQPCFAAAWIAVSPAADGVLQHMAGSCSNLNAENLMGGLGIQDVGVPFVSPSLLFAF